MKAGFQALFKAIRADPRRLVAMLVLGLMAFWVMRDCIAGFSSTQLPNQVLEQIERLHVTCITPDDTPIWPGETRQPECGQVEVEMTAEGVVPPSAQAMGITRAICYRITIENPRWGTMGQTRHELIWFSRRSSKVAILGGGTWQTFQDEDAQDEQRWLDFSCPGAYATD